jgi:phage terminase large subunit
LSWYRINDHDAIIRIALDNKRQIIYADEIIHKNKLSPEALIQLMLLHTNAASLLVADCKNEKTIADLRKHWRVIPAQKSKGSIVNGIKGFIKNKLKWTIIRRK